MHHDNRHSEMSDSLNGKVNPRMKIQSLPTRPHADGKSGEVHKTFLQPHSKTVLQRSHKQLK